MPTKNDSPINPDFDRDYDPNSLGLVDFSSDLDSIWLYGQVDECSAVRLHQAIESLNQPTFTAEVTGSGEKIPHYKGTPIKLYINSVGGYFNSALYIINVIRQSKRPVSTIACAYSMSAACLILAAGHEGMRYAMPDSILMLHEISSKLSGTLSEIKLQGQDLQLTSKIMIRMLNEFTGKPEDKIKEDIAGNVLYLTSKQALPSKRGNKGYGKKGLIDGIWPVSTT